MNVNNRIMPSGNTTSNRTTRSIHDSFKFFIILGQFFGILPQEGIRAASPSDLRFKWRSPRTVYTVFMIVLMVMCMSMCFVRPVAGNFTFDHLVTFTYFANGLVTLILFLHLARTYSKLIKDWCEVDQIMNHYYGYPKSLDFRLRLMTVISVLLVIGNCIFGVAFKATQAVSHSNKDFRQKIYFRDTYPAIFYQFSSSSFLAEIILVTSWICAFIWMYNDLFIILISTALALRFKQITDCILQSEKKNHPDSYWTTVRKNYDLLCVLCKNLDSHISFIVLLSFAGNTFFVLVQLFYSFGTIDEPLEDVYFCYSFSYLVLRLIAVSLYAAWINDESKEPAVILNSIPSATYSLEIRRLLLQISFDNVALTGSKMFKVTRGLILSVASAVVTYELVLIQFNTAASNEVH